MTEIDWTKFESNSSYVKILTGVPKKLRFESMKQDDIIINNRSISGLVFTVVKEDGQEVNKTWTATSKRLIKQLKPFVETGRIVEHEFTITKFGEGFDTQWRIEQGA